MEYFDSSHIPDNKEMVIPAVISEQA